jgi:hypothetical protein
MVAEMAGQLYRTSQGVWLALLLWYKISIKRDAYCMTSSPEGKENNGNGNDGDPGVPDDLFDEHDNINLKYVLGDEYAMFDEYGNLNLGYFGIEPIPEQPDTSDQPPAVNHQDDESPDEEAISAYLAEFLGSGTTEQQLGSDHEGGTSSGDDPGAQHPHPEA